MAKDSSFDIVSKVDLQEVSNAVNQTEKEINSRFDLKGTNTTIEKTDEDITIAADDDFKLKNVIDILQTKLAKRDVSLKSLEYGKVEHALGGRVKQTIKLRQGIDKDHSKKITTLIKDSKIKVQASIQGDAVRVSGKNKDDLQEVMQLLKAADLPIALQFTNYR
ncbi:YajQ family cyclic di-GMP-binding protein [Alkaliphilus serpentinus]|uniref:Nucleotide-binding protein F8153_12205 n=1 Tax=Alkaliphilus serpentinus TaxID=1482731 RepID=A0A833M8U3_9FIRM|nr:YajQ family cyclic di-GMP-binding protein [Alkaliphilus serpentinus]KAB3527351.1 YajQ family cyclic di-GMP-binding protein [Alkaliphilus serpentinus]